MYQLELTTKFKKDIKLAKKRGLNMRLLDEVVTDLVEKGTAAPKNKPHQIKRELQRFLGMSHSTGLAISLETG